MEIETQLELGGETLDRNDEFLLEINLDDLVATSGKTQEYWLPSIKAELGRVNNTTTIRDGH